MSLTGRIRLYLIIVALVPPLLIMSVIYFQAVKRAETASRQEVFSSLQKFGSFYESLRNEVSKGIEQLVNSGEFKRDLLVYNSDKTTTISFDPRSYGLNFAELLTSEMKVLASYHRPGLVGEVIQLDSIAVKIEEAGSFESAEYDVAGAHVALAKLRAVANDIYLYAGSYIDSLARTRLARLMNAEVSVQFHDDSLTALEGMEQGSLYDDGDRYRVLLIGSAKSGFGITAAFDKSDDSSAFYSLLGMTGLVAFFSVALSVGLGMYITGRAEREISNLVRATSRVAAGDFSAPVMAYEEGEFSQLADSFTDMMIKLKGLQKQLATTEKIAAWQIVGRKIAHEIKNPLTPIAISADDLRKSYVERLPEFEKTLEETTLTIKSEVARMNKLLDQFVSFARMKTPELRETEIAPFIANLASLYRRELDDSRLTISNDMRRKSVRIDSELMQQALINLIKNGLESGEDSIVSVIVGEEDTSITFRVDDNGTGFADDKLNNSFEPYVTTKEGGSGLGLVICHRIVFDHGGTMELYNRSNGGAGVLIRIPA